MISNKSHQKKPCNIICYTITFIMVKNKLDFRINIRNNLLHNAFQGIFYLFRGVHLWPNTKYYVPFHALPVRNVRSIAAGISTCAILLRTREPLLIRSGFGN